MNKHKIVISFVVVMLMSLLGGFWYCKVNGIAFFHRNFNGKEGKPIEYSLDYTGIGSLGYIYEWKDEAEKAIDWTDLGNVHLLSIGTDIVRNINYITGDRIGEIESATYASQSPSKVYFYADIYEAKAEERTLVKTLDIFKIVQDYDSNFFPSMTGRISQDKITEEWFLEVAVRDYSKERKSDGWLKDLAINIETEQVKGLFEEGDYFEDGTNKLSPVFTQKVTNVYEKLKERGFSYYNNGAKDTKTDSIYELYFTDKIDYSDLRLAKEYPRSLKFMNERSLFWITDSTNEKDLARLLGTEDEVDVFEGVTLYGAYSKDGQDHVVKSYDDLMNWYQAPEGGE